jgi:Fe-coproporphyrin III synthase
VTRLTGGVSVLQVHPTRRCNLQCAHCYSSSGPREHDSIPSARLVEAITDAGRLGYRQLAVSGGEPFMYPELDTILRAGRAAGMATTMTTNGMLSTPGRLAPLHGLLDAVAVSLDGEPATHNRIRRNRHAFERMKANLGNIAALDVPFGFIFTLTLHNVHELVWAVDFCRTVGAAFLQVHPLTPSGRGVNLVDVLPDDEELAAAICAAEHLGNETGIAVHVDAVVADAHLDVSAFVAEPDAPFAEQVPTLVVLPDGEALPITHDIDNSFRLGNILGSELRDLAEAWHESDRPAALRKVQTVAFRKLQSPTSPRLVYWYDLVAKASRARHPSRLIIRPNCAAEVDRFAGRTAG